MTPEQEQILARLEQLDRPTLERVARLFIENVGYLDQCSPEDREIVDRFSCTNDSWHRCSVGGAHSFTCDGTCGSGEPCTTTQELWCHSSGFDCPECELTLELRRILDSRAREPEAVTTTKETGSFGV